MQETEVSFISGGVRLAGALSHPAKGGARGMVLLLSGSGPQDRDESLEGQKPFRVLAQALSERGYAAYRWDDRGVGASQGDYQAANGEVLVGDVGAAMAMLRERAGISRCVLIGHSQGALIAAAAGARWPDAAGGVALLAGMGAPGRQGLLHQHQAICRASGWSEADIAASLALKSALFDVLMDTPEADLRGVLEATLRGDAALDAFDPEERRALDDAVDDLMEWEWRYLLRAEPAHDLRRLTCPVFAMAGAADVQIDAAASLRAVADACEHAAAVETVLLPGHNHLFQHAQTGALEEYARAGRPFTDAALAPLRRWLDSLRTD